jgi:hypothetical protein
MVRRTMGRPGRSVAGTPHPLWQKSHTRLWRK